jgi:hypothetical protein
MGSLSLKTMLKIFMVFSEELKKQAGFNNLFIHLVSTIQKCGFFIFLFIQSKYIIGFQKLNGFSSLK